MFPLRKQELGANVGLLQSKTRGSELENQQKLTQIQEHKDQITAFRQGYDKGMLKVREQDPLLWSNIQKTQAEAQNNIGQAALHHAQTKAQEVAYYNAAASNVFDAVSDAAKAAAVGGNKAGQAVLDNHRKIMGSSADMLPKVYDDSTLAGYTGLGLAAKQAIADKAAKGLMTPTQKEDVREAELVAKQEAGTLSKSEELQLKRVQERQGSRARGLTNSPTALAIGQADADSLKAVQKANMALPQQIDNITQAEKALARTPDIYLNPFVGMTGLAKINPDAQVLLSNLNSLTLKVKESMNMGSQGFTDKDREFVSSVVGNLSNYKGTLKDLLEQSKSFVLHAQANNWITENNIQKKVPESYDQWIKDHPAPEVQVEVNGQRGTVPADKLNQIIKDKKAKVL